jgi:hypothetical protein
MEYRRPFARCRARPVVSTRSRGEFCRGSHRGYFQVTSIPKKCMKTSRFGLFFGFCCGLRI